jgi:branched-chain amino acid transport system substrate-binding protein
MSKFTTSILVAGAAFAGLMAGTPALAANMTCGLTNGQKASGEPIRLGAIVTASGAADLSNAAKAAKAYFDCVNDNGGINGRPVEYSWSDDQTRPDKAAENAKKLVEDDKVVALVGGASLVDCIATAQYYKDQGVISLMAAGVAPQCFTATNIAAMNSGPRYGLVSAVSYAAKNLGIKHIVCPQPSIPGADWICNGIKEVAELEGLKYSTMTFDQSSADNDSLVQQILATGADATVYMGSPVTMPPFLAAMETADAGSTMKVLAPSPVYNPMIPDAIGPYWNDKLWVSIEFGPLDGDGADAANFRAVAEKYGAVADGFGEMGYLAAKLAVDALLTIPADKVSRETATAALQNVQAFKSDLLCKDWVFGGKDDTARLANRSGWMVQLSESKWKLLSGCVDVDQRVIH